MRLIILATLVLTAAGCDRVDRSNPAPEAAAKASEPVRGAVESGVSTVAAAAETKGCGGACGGSCGGPHSCNGSCGMTAAADTAPATAVPADAVWTDLHVAGMMCGGCARRIKGALAGVQGVLGVEVDLKAAQVRVATAAGVDGRGLAQPAIDALGYQVQ